MKLMVMGYARHGKDTVAEILRDKFGLAFVSSSYYCLERAIFPLVRDRYATLEECYADRVNNRAFWKQSITAYNTPDRARLARGLYSEADVYVGIRCKREFYAIRNAGLFDHSIWVDASDRLPPEGNDSCTVEPWMADYILDNNGTLDELKFSIDVLMGTILGKQDIAA